MTLFLRSFSSTTIPSTLTPQVLHDWLQAIAAFQVSYHQLSQVKLRNFTSELESSLLEPRLSVQLSQSLEQMCQELNALLNELTGSPDSVNLARHAARLRSMTNQAAVMIGLISQSAC